MIELTFGGTPQTVAVGGLVPFNTAARSCGSVERYRAGQSSIELTKPGIYRVGFSANIAGTAASEISVGIALAGEVLPGTIMTVTPAAVGEYFNVAAQTYVKVYPGSTERISVEAVGDTAITVNNQNLTAVRIGGVCNA